ncbi:MAG: membrane protein insertion efficiency factor YidD [SAR202 cluster bacterium]|nr:membrane protein insertion efficiency factor YidD [SAR202 cluster bacterium]
MKTVALAAIRLYQATVSPYMRGACRHEPTCSHYAYEAISKYGVVKGIRLAAGRLGRCRPFGTLGYDPVP